MRVANWAQAAIPRQDAGPSGPLVPDPVAPAAGSTVIRRASWARSARMKIAAAKVIVTCPGRNFVTLKIITDQGVYGIGDGLPGHGQRIGDTDQGTSETGGDLAVPDHLLDRRRQVEEADRVGDMRATAAHHPRTNNFLAK